MDEQQEQQENSKGAHLKPWQFKPGQSGNPAGRPPGSSLKDYAKRYLSGMTDEERVAFFEGIDKIKIWEMAEGKPETKTDITSDGKAINIVVPQAVADAFNLNAQPNTSTGNVHTEQEQV